MKLVVQYRHHASECRALAAKMRTPEERDQLLQTAAQWERLAADREKSIKRDGLEPKSSEES